MFCQPNAVPDIAEIVLDIRPARVEVRSDMIKRIVELSAVKIGCSITDWCVRYDYGSWQSAPSDITKRLPILPTDWQFSVCSGYIDMQLLWEKLDCPIALTVGAGDMTGAHAPDEYVEIDALENLTRFLVHILKS
jgi:acetylornithine deacetylase/succinyl-diaminopimelate desuccinylase-like protein